ncbi:hypothetical protein EVAR_975_1 [Eumeta japonica]|uniref:Uncharacterized protein n=1 Tax=Eumeta variegata TaxID=151549 RepID=A0A4C1SH32_EUMVA|nr:hypothetical protein EVAR_975_1 [Eumeta japonica]
MRCHALAEYRRELSAFAIVLPLVSETSGDPLPSFAPPLSIRYSTQEAGNVLIKNIVYGTEFSLRGVQSAYGPACSGKDADRYEPSRKDETKDKETKWKGILSHSLTA